MKNIKKILAMLMATTMVLSSGVVTFATEDGTGTETETPATTPAPTNNLTVDDHISIKSLQEKDSVAFYKVLAWDNGWKAVAPFASLTPAEVEQILGKPAEGSSPAVPSNITQALAEKIAKLATGAAKYTAVADSTGEAKQEDPEAGLYVGIITAAKAGYIYNPVFVGADYSRTSTTNEWTVGTALSYSDEALAKKADVTVLKTASTTEEDNEDKKTNTHAVGDIVTFTINTTIPEFADNYVNPRFKVSDVLSTGLELDTTSIKVYAGANNTGTLLSATGSAPDYSLNPAATKTGFTVDFSKTYITGLNENQPITIEYQAKITNEAAKSVNEEDNTVTVNFSNSPSDEEGKSILKDKTNHYTFDIDGDLWGEQPYKATEVVKVGIDENGNEITEKITLDNGKTVGALQGAEFKLYKTQTGAQNETAADLYTNDKFNGTVETDAQGRMTIKGLDAGTYYLKETKAPDGYIKDATVHTIQIDATIEDVNVTEYYDTSDSTWYAADNEAKTRLKVDYAVPTLKSYKVLIDGVETASYSITTNATTTKITEQSKGDTVVGTDADKGKIKNTKGLELPSTGGVGTTMMYMFGAIFVMFAGVLLVSKRRMSVR